jgi:hypothetical protein
MITKNEAFIAIWMTSNASCFKHCKIYLNCIIHTILKTPLWSHLWNSFILLLYISIFCWARIYPKQFTNIYQYYFSFLFIRYKITFLKEMTLILVFHYLICVSSFCLLQTIWLFLISLSRFARTFYFNNVENETIMGFKFCKSIYGIK